MRNHYRILGIRPDATREEIKEAWNFSVKAFHPDKFAGSSQRQQTVAQERTKAINEAYEVLSDPIRRANYDWQYARERSTHSAAPPPPPPPPGPSPPPPTAHRPAQTASGHERKQPKAPRTPIFNFQRIIGPLKNCAHRLEKGIANLIRKLRASVNATATFFASLMTRMSKATSELFRWFYGKRKLLASAVILLLAGVGLGMSLSSGPHPLLAKLRRLFAKPLTEPASTPYPPPLTDQLLREGVESRDRGDTTHAIYFLQEARQIEPDNAIVLAELAKTYEVMRLYNYAEEVRHELQQNQTIKRWVDEAAKRGEEWGKESQGQPRSPTTEDRQAISSPDSGAANARWNFDQAQQAFRRRDFASALKFVEQADKGEANQPVTINLRGEILMQQGQFDDAEAAFKKAASLDPKLRDAQYNLAQIPLKKKEYAKARDRFETLYKRIPGGDKNQAAELIKFKIYMTLLMEGKESRAHSMMEEFQFTSDTPVLYYAQAAWEYKHNNAQKAEDWTNSANKIYSPALNGVFADAFYDVGWLQRPAGTTAPAVAFDTNNVGASQAESGPAVEPSPIPDKGVAANKQAGMLTLAAAPSASDNAMDLGTADATGSQTRLTGPSAESAAAGGTAADFAEQSKKLRERTLVDVDDEQTTKKELEPNATPADTATIKKWGDDALKRGEEWGENTSYYQARQALTRKDYTSAASSLQQSADLGYAPSQALLAWLYANGKGVPPDYHKAVELYQKAADQGYPAAQARLALLYSGSKGVPQDYRKAAELLRRAADQGYAEAQVNLGWFYHQGWGVPQDYRKGVELYQKAADQGYAVGQAYLASAYADGKGVPREYQKARDLFQKAFDQGTNPYVLNDFAWFLATCPDASQRNGKQAVEYATKACELTQWKEANFIETLAAAYAEGGDFATAIKYQKQAMAIPDSNYPDKQEMKRSMDLYSRREPYRQQ